jgi:DivIVA domain-containing protein
VSTTFPRTRQSKPGYDVNQVEDFLEEARRAYTSEPGVPVVVTSSAIRRQSFAMQKGGYSTSHVDAALERLEDAFAARERERAFAANGEQAWYDEAKTQATTILERLSRPAGQRFDRVGVFTTGYDRKEVDAFVERVVGYFQHGRTLSVDQVRTVVFSGRKHGYSEAQVDLVLDSVVEIMLAVR